MNKENQSKTAVALGYFDGLHRAHIEVLRNALAEKSRGVTPVALLFDEHPLHAIAGKDVPALLQEDKRDEILSSMGLETVVLPFSQLRELSPREFVSRVLVGELNAVSVFCGFDYRFGKDGEGSVDALRQLGEEFGFSVHAVPERTMNGEKISSTDIRRKITDGEIAAANELLGRPFGFSAPVFSGDHRGRTLGMPTINQYLPENLVVPRFGVYVSRVIRNGKEYKGLTNIGSRPTFGEGTVRSETYIFDFEGDLYGKTVEIRLLAFLRPERRFDSAEELVRQIREDIKNAASVQ